MVKLYPTLIASLLLSNTISAQYCTNVGSTTGADSNMMGFNLGGESGTSISYTAACPGTIGLNDQTLNESVTLAAGMNYTAFAQFGTCGGNYSGVAQGWIDYNQNQVFEPAESIGTWSGIPPTPVSNWPFTVPAGALSGTTRMRIVQYEGGFLPIDPCSQFPWGSTVDFTVVIGGGTDCSAYVGESIDDPRIVSSLPFSESHNNTVCYTNVQTAYNSPDVFYRILPNALGVDFLEVSLCGSSFDTWLAILDTGANVLWYNDDAAACGGTQSEIIIPTDGIDTLYIVVQGWGFSSGDYDIAINQQLTAIEDNGSVEFNLFPNPAREQFIIASTISDGRVVLYDATGKMVLASEFKNNQVVDVSGIAPGTYFVKLSGEKGETVQKLVIE
jgi:hypothetical protein